MLQPIVNVISLLLIDSTALQQSFTQECEAYLEEGGTLVLRLPKKNGEKKNKIELEEKATIVQNLEHKFGLSWGKDGEEVCFDNDCVKKFVEKAAKGREDYALENDRVKYYSYVTYYDLRGKKIGPLDKHIVKARQKAEAAEKEEAATKQHQQQQQKISEREQRKRSWSRAKEREGEEEEGEQQSEQYFCDFGCGYTGGFIKVQTHQATCRSRPRSWREWQVGGGEEDEKEDEDAKEDEKEDEEEEEGREGGEEEGGGEGEGQNGLGASGKAGKGKEEDVRSGPRSAKEEEDKGRLYSRCWECNARHISGIKCRSVRWILLSCCDAVLCVVLICFVNCYHTLLMLCCQF